MTETTAQLHPGVIPKRSEESLCAFAAVICSARGFHFRHPTSMRILKAALVYFALVFGIGFVLGTIRTMWIAPRLGERWAELGELPIMLAATIVAARWTVLHLSVPSTRSARLRMGAAALGLMLLAEFGLLLWVRGLSITEYFATRDPISGTAYYVALAVFALMPLFVARR
jgi:hypothetical protein